MACPSPGCRWCRWLPRHLRSGVNQTVALSSMVLLLPLPQLPKQLLRFAAVSLPFCVLNSIRLSGVAAESKQQALLPPVSMNVKLKERYKAF